MDAILQSQFQRVESALNTLVDSIASYNPSTTAAQDLLNADDELTAGLNQLSKHQANHRRILSLRSTSEALDGEITSTLRLLATTRAELLALPAGPAPADDARPVPYAELLAYAKRISKFSVPPPGYAVPQLQPQPPAEAEAQAHAQQTGQKQIDSAGPPNSNPTNGTPAPAPATASPNPGGDATQHIATSANTGIALTSLDAPEQAWLNPSAHIPFVPWPSEETIRRGALAHIQTLLEQGQDPDAVAASVESAASGPEGTAAAALGAGDVRMGNAEPETETETKTVGQTQQSQQQQRPAERERDERPQVFAGLDLYDPEDE
ncbi:MAG: hypothetical protein M1819_001339 [Sarea resinae]|nr:MAG: hypothetical protein M1819_001339 [Sarea resinae]